VRADHVNSFREQASLFLGQVREMDGCGFAQVGRQVNKDGSEEVVVVTSWTCLDAIYAWVGGSDLLSSPLLAGRLQDLLEHHDIQHYEAFGPAEADAAAGDHGQGPTQGPGTA
jgi:hypothetical protein